MKGISPLIATVLLIAFTIGVGGLISIFATGLAKTQAGVTSNQSETLSRCAGAAITISSAQSSTIIYYNPTPQTITNVMLTATDGKTTTGDTSMTPGETSVTAWTAGTNTSVIARGLCQSILPVEGSCVQGHACWDV